MLTAFVRQDRVSGAAYPEVLPFAEEDASAEFAKYLQFSYEESE